MLYELIAGLKCYKCRKGYIWCIDGSFIHPLRFKKSGKTAYGYALNDHTVASLKMSDLTYKWSDARSYCTGCKNDGKSGYLPDRYELRSLYSSIMSGNMKDDLKIAEIYGIYGMCNYKEPTAAGWGWVWSGDNNYDSRYVYYVYYDGRVGVSTVHSTAYVIPFFKF